MQQRPPAPPTHPLALPIASPVLNTTALENARNAAVTMGSTAGLDPLTRTQEVTPATQTAAHQPASTSDDQPAVWSSLPHNLGLPTGGSMPDQGFGRQHVAALTAACDLEARHHVQVASNAAAAAKAAADAYANDSRQGRAGKTVGKTVGKTPLKTPWKTTVVLGGIIPPAPPLPKSTPYGAWRSKGWKDGRDAASDAGGGS
jgi:hypothetical protein